MGRSDRRPCFTLVPWLVLHGCAQDQLQTQSAGMCQQWDDFNDPSRFEPPAPSSYDQARPQGMDVQFLSTETNSEVNAKCIDCHEEDTPAEVARYLESTHAELEVPVRCVDCHGRLGHGEYLAFGYRFRARTIGIDGQTEIGGNREHTYFEWQPKMVVQAMQSCQRSDCHARQYEQHVGVDRVVQQPSTAVTPFHGMLRFDHGISSWNDTMMSSFGLALWETYGTDVFRENCVRCHSQAMAFNVAGSDPEHMSARDPFLRTLLAAQARDIPSFAGVALPGVADSPLLLTRCVECHVRHEFSRSSPRNATACGKCHSGPDHPQIEAFDLSKHRLVVDQLGVYTANNPDGGPSCSTCHFDVDRNAPATSTGPAIHHDLTRGIAWNYREGDEWRRERNTMLERCTTCHSRTYAEVQLLSADSVARGAGAVLLGEIQELCDAAVERGIIEPAPNPFFDESVQFLPTFFHAMPWQTGKYRVSNIEAACWDAWREGGVVSQETGAWHFSPGFTHWRGTKPADEFIGRLRELIAFAEEGYCAEP